MALTRVASTVLTCPHLKTVMHQRAVLLGVIGLAAVLVTLNIFLIL
jgi:hypothetical protein